MQRRHGRPNKSTFKKPISNMLQTLIKCVFFSQSIIGKLGWLRRNINWMLILKNKANGSKHTLVITHCYHQCVLSAKTFHVPQSRVLHYWFWAHPVPLWLMIHTVWLEWHIHCGAAQITYSSKSFWQAWAWLYTWSCFVKTTRSLEIALWLCS